MPPASSAAPTTEIDGVPHAPPPLTLLQREAEQSTTFGCAAPAAATADGAAPAGKRILHGSLVTVVGYGSSQVIRLAGNILISRLVLPEAFGIMALVNILIQGLSMFSDVGIEAALVQHRRGDEPRFYNTSWTVQVLRGLLLFVAASILAWPAALIYDEPRLLTLLPVAAVASVVAGFNSTALFAVRRHLLLGRLTALELVSQIAGVVAMCAWAAAVSAGAWAMIAGLFATVVVNLVGSHLLLPGYRNRFAWDRDAVAALVRFGRWVLLSTMITFCALQVDRLLLGRLVTKEMLGVYSVALAVAMLPNMLLQTLAGAVIYPLMARAARRSPDELCRRLSAARGPLSALGVFFVAGVVLEAETFFALLYNERYAAAGRIAQWLAVGVWVSTLSTTLERVPQALGETRLLAAYNFVKLLATSVASLVGYYLGGLEGFIFGCAAGIAVGHVTLAWMLQSQGAVVWRDDLRSTASALLVVWVGLALRSFAAALFAAPAARFWVGEFAAWCYLAGVGGWALQKSRSLARLDDA